MLIPLPKDADMSTYCIQEVREHFNRRRKDATLVTLLMPEQTRRRREGVHRESLWRVLSVTRRQVYQSLFGSANFVISRTGGTRRGETQR